MTTLTMRYMRGHFIVTGPDVEPVMFKSRREARDNIIRVHRSGKSAPTRPSERPIPSGRWERIHRERIIPVGSGAPAASHRHS